MKNRGSEVCNVGGQRNLKKKNCFFFEGILINILIMDVDLPLQLYDKGLNKIAIVR